MRSTKPALLLSALLVAVLAVVGWLVLALDDGGGGAPAIGRAGAGDGAAPEGPARPGGGEGAGGAASPRPASDAAREELRGPAGADARDAGLTAGDRALAGRVVDGGGAPVAGARVLLGTGRGGVRLPLDADPEVLRWFEAVREARTDAVGAFRFEGLAERALRLAVRAPGFAPYEDGRVVLGEPETTRWPDVVLRPGIVLEGVVLDPAGRPVAGAELARLAEGPIPFGVGHGRLGRTGKDGSFRVDTLAPGPWALQVRTPDWPVLVERGDAPRPGQVVGGLVLQLERGGAIAGRVVGPGPVPLEELAVVATLERRDPPWDSERTAAVAADGTFELRGLLPERAYELAAGPRGSVSWNLLPVTAPVTARTGDRGVELRRLGGGDVVLRPVDADTGAPLEAVTVRVEPESAERRRLGARGVVLGPGDARLARDEDGALRALGMARVAPGGTLKIDVSAAGYRAWTAAGVPAVAGEDVDLGTVALEPVPGVRARVVDAATGEPVEGAVVHLRSTDPGAGRVAARLPLRADELLYTEGHRRATTDAEGRATVPSENGQLSFVWAHHAGYAPTWPVQARPTSSGEVELRLRRGGTLEVRVTGADGRPAADASVALARVPDDPSGAVSPARTLADLPTDTDGVAVFEHLVPGAYQVALLEDEQAGAALLSSTVDPADALEDPGRARVLVEDGLRQTVQLLRRPRGSLVGVVSEAGHPLAGATVRLVPSPGVPASLAMRLRASAPVGRTDGEGAFRLGSVRTGPWQLVVEHPARAMGHVEPVTVAAGETRVSVELDDAAVAGWVRDAAGAPIPGARVWLQRADEPEDGFTGQIGAAVAARALRTGSADATTDAGGAFALRGVRTNLRLVAAASHPDYRATMSTPLVVEPGQRLDELVLTLQRAGSLVVRVVGGVERRAAVLLTPVGFDEPVPPTAVRPTEGDGVARFTGVAPGTWNVEVSDLRAAGTPTTRRVVVAPGEAAEVEIPLP